MLLNLDLRLKEATENNASYLEFFELMVQDELFNREANLLTKRLKAARFVAEQTFEGFDFKFNEDSLPSAMLRELATCRYVDLRENVIIAGPPGIGKTHVACALGHQACRKGHNVLFHKTHQWLEEQMNARLAGRSTFKKALKAEVLILDDFGFRKLLVEEAETLYALVDERLGRGTTIVTSNRPPEDWIQIFPDAVMGGAVLDRLVSGAHKILADSKARSYRQEYSKRLDEGGSAR
jgi:DNA replication protein DnaC